MMKKYIRIMILIIDIEYENIYQIFVQLEKKKKKLERSKKIIYKL